MKNACGSCKNFSMDYMFPNLFTKLISRYGSESSGGHEEWGVVSLSGFFCCCVNPVWVSEPQTAQYAVRAIHVATNQITCYIN